jgi:hypothetical protein
MRVTLQRKACKIQLVQKLRANDKPSHHIFTQEMLSRLDDDCAFLKHVGFSDEVTFPFSAKVNRHSCQIWGSEQSHEVMEHECGTPRLNVWCAQTCDFFNRTINF